MEFKGSKKPWRYHEFNDRRLIPRFIIKSYNGDTVCKILRDDMDDNIIEKANAQLIIKALEMLEALKHSLEILVDCNPPDYLVETYGNAIMNYEQLIKEATTIENG